MSTVVQPRREAASYVSTHAGAVGEMVIDTTHQRVTVHDGATPGGFPQAAITDLVGRNRIINGNFAINQRGYVSGGTLASNGYAHDRWKDTGAGTWKYTFTQGVPDTLITITAGAGGQVIDAANIEGGNYMVSWAGTAPVAVFFTNASGSTSVSGAASPLAITGVVAGTQVSVTTNGNGTFGVVQLESGTVATKFERRHIGQETVLCQRYFRQLRGNGNDVASVNAQSNTVNIYLGDVSSMRASPTLVHNLADANYVTAAPTGSQWLLSQPGYAASGKNGTASFVATSGPVSAYVTVICAFSPLPTSLALGPTAFFTLSSEL